MTKHRTQKEESKRMGRIVLFSLIAFFATFASVDALFIYLAAGSHRGVVTENVYEKGLAFNETLKKAAADAEVSPVERISYEGGKLNIHLKDEEDFRSVVAHLKHPVQDGQDMRLNLQAVSERTYVSTELLPKGNWHMILELTWNNEAQTTYHLNEELSLH